MDEGCRPFQDPASLKALGSGVTVGEIDVLLERAFDVDRFNAFSGPHVGESGPDDGEFQNLMPTPAYDVWSDGVLLKAFRGRWFLDRIHNEMGTKDLPTEKDVCDFLAGRD